MSERADYIRGLRALADLLEQHPHLPAATWTLDGDAAAVIVNVQMGR